MNELFAALADAFRRLTAREFLVGIAAFIFLLLSYERGYEVSEEIRGAIVLGLLVGAGWRIAQKNGSTS